METPYAGFSQKLSELITALNLLGKEVVQSLFIQISPVAAQKNQDLFTIFHDLTDVGYFLIVEGAVEYSVDKLVFLTYEPNDLICLFNHNGSELHLTVKSEQVKLIPVTYHDIFMLNQGNLAKAKVWNNYIIKNMGLLIELLACFAQFKINWRYDIKTFQPNQVIIKEDEEAENAYLLLDGQAHAYVDNIKMGDIEVGEVFGAIAVLTGQKRNATIHAHTTCKVLDLPKTEFLKFVTYCPKLSARIISDMANIINRLNHSLAEK